jgi:hypothetical protein
MQASDLKYISLISTSLRNFKNKGNNCWNFSCPICGDSEKDRKKARGYLLVYKDKLFYKCHNCQVSCRFSNFLKEQFPLIYQQYSLERLQEQTQEKIFITRKEKIVVETIKKLALDRLSDLEDNHVANQYYNSRKLPSSGKQFLYFTEDFRKFALDVFKNEKYSNLKDNDSRIVLPCFDRNNELISVQGRSLIPNEKQRYVSARFEHIETHSIFGIERIDFTKTIYVVEGAFDSLLLPNCIAVNTSGLSSIIKKEFENELNYNDLLSNKFVLVHDNQPRNSEIIKEYEKSIRNGFQVVVFPEKIIEKDLNEMHLTGLNVYDIIKNNTYKGVELEIFFSSYRKV